jgi:hypothetical protein
MEAMPVDRCPLFAHQLQSNTKTPNLSILPIHQKISPIRHPQASFPSVICQLSIVIFPQRATAGPTLPFHLSIRLFGNKI